jgi:hypothetical protein
MRFRQEGCDWPIPALMAWAADATSAMVVAMSPAPVAASATLRLISLVVAVCSSTVESARPSPPRTAEHYRRP